MARTLQYSLHGVIWLVLSLLALSGRWLSTSPRELAVMSLALVTIALFGLFHLVDRLRRALK